MDQQNKLTLPIAIVIAGILIAGAIFVSKNGSTPQVANTNTGAAQAQVKVDPITASDHIIGNPSAPIVMIEYSDLECPFCKEFHSTLSRIMTEYGKGGQVAWVYRHFPLDQLHPKARHEAEASECAASLGGNQGFWNYINRIFEITPSNNGLDPDLLTKVATDIGLDKTAFQACLDSGKFADAVQKGVDSAIRAGGQGTPHTILLVKGGSSVPIEGAQPYLSVKSAIDTILKSISTGTPSAQN